jgi:hypothetical protein
MGNTESTAFPYTLGTPIHSYVSSTGWTLFDGYQNSDSSPVSIFCFDKIKNSGKVDCARNGMTMLRQLRHPSVLKYITCVEQTNNIYIVTEPIKPLFLPFIPEPDDGPSSTRNYNDKKDNTSTGGLAQSDSKRSYNSNDTSDVNVTQNSVLTQSALNLHLKPLETTSLESIQLLISAGLSQIYTAVEFLNFFANIIHGNISSDTIFISKSGDWKLGGFDLAFKATMTAPSSNNAGSPADTDAFLDLHNGDGGNQSEKMGQTSTTKSPTKSTTKITTINSIPTLFRNHYSLQKKDYLLDEIKQNHWKRIERYPVYIIDAYAMGQLLSDIFCVQNSHKNSHKNSTQKNSPIPPLLLREYNLYHSPNTPQQIDDGITYPNLPKHSTVLQSTYFNNHVIAALQFLDSIHIKSTEEKTLFFTQFSTIYTMFPTSILRNRIIPQLVLSFEVITPKSAGSSFAGILNSTFAVSKVCLHPDEYTQFIVPLIKKLFQSTDLEIRMSLLQSMKEFAHFLTIDMVFNDILPTIIVGIYDENPIVRELTIISLIYFYPHFLKVKNGDFDSAYKNIAIISNKVAYDAYNYATNTFSYVSNYLGYNINGQNNSTQNGSNLPQNNNQHIASHHPKNSSQNSYSPSLPPNSTQTNPANPSTTQSSTISNNSTQTNPHLYTLPSLYLPQIVFPLLIAHYPNELLPQIRSAILLAATSLAPLLSISLQETLLLTIYAKGMKDSSKQVKKTALDGLIISLLTSSFTINTLCNKIIPFTCSYICDKDTDIGIRAIFILQYCLYKVQYQYGGSHGGNASGSHTNGGSNNQVNILQSVQNFPIQYPMLNLDLTQLSEQVQLAQGSIGGAAGSYGGVGSHNDDGLLNKFGNVGKNGAQVNLINGVQNSGLAGTIIDTTITTITSSSIGTNTAGMNPLGKNTNTQFAFGDVIDEENKKSKKMNQNNFNFENNISQEIITNKNDPNNDSKLSLDGYEDWSSLTAPMPAVIQSTAPLYGNNNNNNTHDNTQNNNQNKNQNHKIKKANENIQNEFELDFFPQKSDDKNSKNNHQRNNIDFQTQELDIFESFSPNNNTNPQQHAQLNNKGGNLEWSEMF